MIRIYCLLVLVYLNIRFVSGQGEWKPPDSPENVRAKASTNSITIWWDTPSNAKEVLVRGYTLSYGIETPSRRVIIEGVHTNAFTVDGLQPNTTYIFALTAYNEAIGEDSERVLLSATTEPVKDDSATRLQPPTNIQAQSGSPSELLVQWTDPDSENADINRIGSTDFSVLRRRFYVLEYWNFDVERREGRKKLTTDSTKLKLNQLEPGQKYALRIKIVLHGGQESEWSETVFTRTPVDVTQVPGEVEKCNFETPNKCDYVSDTNGLYDWVRVPSENGHSMLLDATDLGEPADAQSFGRLLSPVFNLRPSSHVCISLHYFISPGSKGVLKLSLLFEGYEQERAM